MMDGTNYSMGILYINNIPGFFGFEKQNQNVECYVEDLGEY